ncbi:hypothetical protein LUZ60_002251 [Juncus effusus]|nr:hypothetical protein LUZ60_002251 [Juncus effusus]
MGPETKTKQPKPAKSSSNGSSTKKRKSENLGEEEQGKCKLPMTRVWKMIHTQDLGAKTTNESVFLITKASEMFLEKFAEDAYKNRGKERKKMLHYNHLASVVSNQKRYEFLSDFVPEKIRAEDALNARAALNDS